LPPHRVDSFFFYVPVHHHHLHSFPTRRSSDLANVANIKRSSTLEKMSFILSFTTCSDIVKPGISLLVLSDSKHRTPSRPISAILDRKSTRLNSSHVSISYAVFCLKKKKHYTIS